MTDQGPEDSAEIDTIVEKILRGAKLLKEVRCEPKVYRTQAALKVPGQTPDLRKMTLDEIRANLESDAIGAFFYVIGPGSPDQKVVRLDPRVIPAIKGAL